MSDDNDRAALQAPTSFDHSKRRTINTRGRARSGDMITLEAWIQGARIDADKTGPCTAFALVHRPTDKELHFCTLGGSPGRSDAELSALFLGVAQSYAESIAGVQSFEMMAFYGKNEPEAFKPFQLTGRTEFDGLATEAPDKTGVTAQGMRLTEMLVQGAFRAIESGHKISREIMQDISGENKDLRAENRELFRVVKDMLVEQAKQNHERQMEEARYQRQSEERATLMRMVPALANSVLGKEIFPQSTADTALITTAVEHLTPDQLSMLGTVLPPEVWGPLSARMTQILEEKEKNRLRSKEIALATPPVDADDPMAGEK